MNAPEKIHLLSLSLGSMKQFWIRLVALNPPGEFLHSHCRLVGGKNTRGETWVHTLVQVLMQFFIYKYDAF